ncbi:MAG TPA: N-acetyl-alpha-D-glucosaminyl L-malate synthase BshA [Phycisphaerae bacterium]|nr:N-acetyl-alpha-D-glucosaminyl L-malate synthase BshA [Phycisphaerae bacterium]
MPPQPPAPLRIAITCYPSVGGSGILASALGLHLAARGHEIHFISYERPIRLPNDLPPRIHFHPVDVNDYQLFKYPDYTLPLSVTMAQVAQQHHLDILHVHYAVPHATAALLARGILNGHPKPRIITTLHGTDTTLLARDPAYAPAIRYALRASDALTAVSHFLANETHDALNVDRPIDVIHNFFAPTPPARPRDLVRQDLGLADDQPLLVHLSNLRPIKRIDILLAAAALLPRDIPWKLLILAGDSFAPFLPEVRRLHLADRLLIRERVPFVEEFLNAADLALFASDSESFCLSILEAMCFALPAVATRVGGIPEVTLHGKTSLLVPPHDPVALAAAATELLRDPQRRAALGQAAQQRAAQFSPEVIVPQYESLYHRVLSA